MFFGSTRHQWLTPKAFFEIGYLKTTELPLSTADANSQTAILQSGKMVDMKDNSEQEMKLGTGFAIGILTRPISALGTRSLTAYQQLTTGKEKPIDLPVSRGLCVTVQCPYPGAEMIFEGAADITLTGTVAQAIDHLVVKTGTGAIGAGTAINTELSVVNGAWRIAQSGDFVLALLRQSNYTPNNTGEIRIRVRFVSPYKKA